MKEQEEFKDDFIKDIVKKGARSLPNHHFENQMMIKIHAANNYKKQVAAKLELSLWFFLGAIILGISLMLGLLFGEFFFEHYSKTLTILTFFIIGIIGILNIDNYRRLINKYSS